VFASDSVEVLSKYGGAGNQIRCNKFDPFGHSPKGLTNVIVHGQLEQKISGPEALPKQLTYVRYLKTKTNARPRKSRMSRVILHNLIVELLEIYQSNPRFFFLFLSRYDD
jgi:hypothetical protein